MKCVDMVYVPCTRSKEVCNYSILNTKNMLQIVNSHHDDSHMKKIFTQDKHTFNIKDHIC